MSSVQSSPREAINWLRYVDKLVRLKGDKRIECELDLIIGILTSVLIYYVNYFSGILGENEKIPISISIWMPLFIFGLISSIGMVKINEK